MKMNKAVLVGALSSMAMLTATTALATTVIFGPQAGLQYYVVPYTTAYTIYAAGGSGGNAFTLEGGEITDDNEGGLGAVVGGLFTLNAGTQLAFAVGDEGQTGFALQNISTRTLEYGAGGGAATTVASSSGLLLVAGGGGGAGSANGSIGGDAMLGQGGSFSGGTNGAGGAGGQSTFGSTPAGAQQQGGGGGGAGFFSVGGDGAPYGGGRGGGFGFGGMGYGSPEAAVIGGSGGDGSLGGGGGGKFGEGGGGGGFSGGAGGDNYQIGTGASANGGAGGGGGSYNKSDIELFSAVIQRGSGGASISFDDPIITAAVPEPSTWAMLLVGFGGTGAMIRRRTSTKRVAAWAKGHEILADLAN